MSRLVKKFGGTSLRDLERIRNAAARIKTALDEGHEVAVAVSAMAGETDRLIELCNRASVLCDAAEFDAVVATGEQVSAGLLAIVLRDIGVPARSFAGWQVPIKTGAEHGSARVQTVRFLNDRILCRLSRFCKPVRSNPGCHRPAIFDDNDSRH